MLKGKKFDDWKKSVNEMNQFLSKIDKERNEIYEWLATEIKDLFESNGLPTRNVNFTNDGSVIQVWIDGNTDKSISFSRDFIESINMPFSVKRMLNSMAENELFVELYPLEEN